MKLKKILALCLALCLVFSLVACGKKDKEKDGGKTPELPVWREFSTEATTEKTVLTAQNGCTVTIEPVSYANEYVEMRVNFHNPTESEKVLELEAIAINGMMLNVYMSVYAQPDEEAFDLLGASQDELRIKGIFEIATIDILFTVTDEEAGQQEALSCQLKSSAQNVTETPDAYYNAITSQEAQAELEYAIVNSNDERFALGNDVYLESKILLDQDFMLLEVVNEADTMRHGQISTDLVNGMYGTQVGESYTLFPGARAIYAIDLAWSLPKTMRLAFGMEKIASVNLFSEIYLCMGNGDIDWESDGEYMSIRYLVPDTTETPDMTSGAVLYEEKGLKVIAKTPVQGVDPAEQDSTYVYLIFVNTGDSDLEIVQDSEKQILVNGDCEMVYFQEPYYLFMDDSAICHVLVDKMSGSSVTIPLLITAMEGGFGIWDVELTVPF